MLLIGLAVTAGSLALALRGTEWNGIKLALRGANYAYLLPVVLAYSLVYWLKALRMALLLRPQGKVRISQVVPATYVGNMATLILPAYAGEVLRGVITARQLELGSITVLSAMVLERLLDFVSLLLLIGVLLMISAPLPAEIAMLARMMGVLTLILMGAVLFALLMAPRTLRWLESRVAPRPSVWKEYVLTRARQVLSGLGASRQPLLIGQLLAASLAQWIVTGVCINFALAALHIEAPFTAGFTVMILVVAAMTLPSTPGFFGTVQLGFTLGLAPFAVDANQAFAASIFFHVTIYLTALALGLFYLHRLGWTLGTLRREASRGREA